MNNEQIFHERKRSNNKKKVIHDKLAEEQEKLNVDKVTLVFELSVLARERRSFLEQIEKIKIDTAELSLRKDVLTKLSTSNKVSLKFYKEKALTLGEEAQSLANVLNELENENSILINLIDSFSDDMNEKMLLKETLSKQIITMDKTILGNKEVYLDLTSRLKSLEYKIIELENGKSIRKKENADLDKKIAALQKILEVKSNECQELEKDYLHPDNVKNKKMNYYERIKKENIEISNSIKKYKDSITMLQGETFSLTSQMQQLSAENEKLKELDMISAMTIEHVRKENSDLSQRILKYEEKITTKRSDLKDVTAELKDQQLMLSITKNEEKMLPVKMQELIERVERTKVQIKINNSFLKNLEADIIFPDLPTDM